MNQLTRAAFDAARGTKRSTLEAIADGQRRLITTAQLLTCGVGPSGIRERCISGNLHRAYRNVYLVGARTLDEPRRRLGVTLSYGGDAALTGRDALDGWNFTRFTRRQRHEPIQVISGTARRRRIPDTALTRSRNFTAAFAARHKGERLVTVPWMITDLGQSLTAYQLANVLHEAAFHHQVGLEEVEQLLAVRGPFAGASIVRRAIALARSGSAGTRSFTEDEFIDLLTRLGIRMPIVNTIRNYAGQLIEADFVWVGKRVVIEIDGGQHGATQHSRDDDRRRDDAYRAAGYQVVRIAAGDVWNRPEVVAERVLRALGR